MQPINLSDITAYVEAHIGTFHAKRLEKLEKLNFKEVLSLCFKSGVIIGNKEK